jgi:hypothetical protein
MEPIVKLIKDWRNKVGAHRSLMITIELVDYIRSGHTKPHPLPHIPLMKVHAALKSLVTISDILFEYVSGQFVQWYESAIVNEVEAMFAIGPLKSPE